MEGNNRDIFQKKKLLWISPLILDIHFHKTTQLEILRSMTKRAYSPTLVGVHSRKRVQNNDQDIRVISIPMRYVPVLSPIMFTILTFFLLPFYIIFSKPDYIIAEPDVSVFALASAFPFLLLNKPKLILDIRSTPVEVVGFRGYLNTFCFRASVIIAKNLFSGMTILTPSMREEVCKKFNIKKDFVGVWSSGVSTALFNPHAFASKVEELKAKLGLSKKFIIFYHGSFSPNRGLKETIQAMQLIQSQFSDAVFFLIGNGSAVDYLKNLVKTAGLQQNVVIHGPVAYEEIPMYIAMADVGIVPLPDHPYWRFQSPLKLLEYLAMGKTVILTDIPAHRSVVCEEKCVIYISSINPDEIAKAIAYAYNNKKNLTDWGKCGPAIVEEKYTWDQLAETLDNYLLSRDAVSRP